MSDINIKSTAIKVVGVLAIALLAIFSKSIIEINNAEEYRIKQGAMSGKLTVRNTPGPYAQMFGRITPMKYSDIVYFSKFEEDGGKDARASAIKVQFSDGSTAMISGMMKFRLSNNETHQIQMLKDGFTNMQSVRYDLVRQQIVEALQQTAPHFKAEEVYAARRSEFTALAESQLISGIYAVTVENDTTRNADGQIFLEKLVTIENDENGIPKIRKNSPFESYDIQTVQFVIKDIDFDKTIDALIAKKKEAEQQKVVARANAEKAKQDAITEFEQGQARIAKEKADKEVEKISEVTQAKKNFEVAKYAALQAKEEAKKIRAEGEAKAAANQALVRAGLTPLERANIDKDTKIGVAKALATWKGPEIVAGGSGKGSSPMDALFIKQMMDISARLDK